MAYETSIKKDQNQPILHDFSTIISRYDILGGGIHGKTSKVDQLVSILVEYIKTNDLRAGTKLTNERDLGKILNVSSRSLREALITLSTLGLLEANLIRSRVCVLWLPFSRDSGNPIGRISCIPVWRSNRLPHI
jgi:hypothetical protein